MGSEMENTLEKLNILEFIDSPVIREFHKNTVFAPEEQAVLIVNSDKRTIEEKIPALEYLLETYPDYDAPLYGDGWGKNFRELTQNTLKKWKALLAARYKQTGYVYMAELLEKNTAFCHTGYGNLYTDYDKAYDFLQKEKQEYLDDEDDTETYGLIKRIKLNPEEDQDAYRHGEYYFNNENKLVRVDGFLDELEEVTLWDELENASFFLELPFKAGDIIKVKSLCNPTYYGVFTGRWKRSSYPGAIEMICSLDIYNSDRDLFGYTDNTPILGMSLCKEEDLPEEDVPLKLLRQVYTGELDICSMLMYYGKKEMSDALK